MGEASGWLNRWINVAPDDWYPRYLAGALFEYLNEASLAAVDFDFVRRTRPADEAIRVRTGLMLSLSGLDCNRAMSYLEPYRGDHPEDVDVVVAVARCQRMQQHGVEAEALLRPVVAAHPDAADAVLMLAMVESDRGDDRAALELLRGLEPLVQAVALRGHGGACAAGAGGQPRAYPERLQVIFMLSATILSRLGRTEEAKHYVAEADQIDKLGQELTKALDDYHHDPHDIAVLEKVGMLNLKLGMPDDGTAALQLAVQEVQRPNRPPGAASITKAATTPELRRQAERHRQFVGSAPPSSLKLQGP